MVEPTTSQVYGRGFEPVRLSEFMYKFLFVVYHELFDEKPASCIYSWELQLKLSVIWDVAELIRYFTFYC